VSDYIQLMKLRIASLLLLVAAAGYISTSGVGIDPVAFGLLMITGLLAAGGSSAINQYLDRDLDSAMRRTRGRPLPQHRIEPPSRALLFGGGLLGIALLVSFVGINPLTTAMIALGAFFYLGIYTIGLKRHHASNIVIGGFAGSCPALAGSAAAAGAISVPAALLALLVFLWTPGHFWALAYSNREDYRRAGIPMLPAVYRERTTVWAIAVSTVLVPAATFAFVLTPSFQVAFLLVAVAVGAVLLALTARFVRHPSARAAWAGYRFSGTYLAVILFAAIVDALVFAR